MGRLAHMQTLLTSTELPFVCFFLRTNACAKRFTWKWLDFHANERTGDIYFHTSSCAQTRFATEAKVNLGLSYSSMSWLRSLWFSFTYISFHKGLASINRFLNESLPCKQICWDNEITIKRDRWPAAEWKQYGAGWSGWGLIVYSNKC